MIHIHMFFSIHHIDFKCQLFITLNYILGLSIFVSGDNKERKNGALNVVDVDIYPWFEKLSRTIQILEDY